MKTFLTLIASSLLLSVPAVATETGVAEGDEILHAVFAAFQEPGILSEEHIAASQTLLVSAAENGNYTARLVVDRGNIQAVTAADTGTRQGLLVAN